MGQIEMAGAGGGGCRVVTVGEARINAALLDDMSLLYYVICDAGELSA